MNLKFMHFMSISCIISNPYVNMLVVFVALISYEKHLQMTASVISVKNIRQKISLTAVI